MRFMSCLVVVSSYYLQGKTTMHAKTYTQEFDMIKVLVNTQP